MKYQPALDGLRGVAVLMVVVSHTFPRHLPGAWVGVEVFFVLSGYLITRLLVTEYNATGRIDYLRFYWRRALRLMPALWCLLSFLFVIFTSSPAAGDLLKAWVMAATYLMNWNRAFAWWPQDPLGHTWSLAAEEQFYLLWPLLFAFAGKHALRFAIIGIVTINAWRLTLILTGADSARIYNGFDTHADTLLIGCALALLPAMPRLAAFSARAWPLFAATLLIGMLTGATRPQELFGFTIAAISSAAIILCADRSTLRDILSTRPLIFCGKISYALYLWHLPLIFLAGQRWPGISPIIPAMCAFPVAALSYFTVERYFRRMRDTTSPLEARI